VKPSPCTGPTVHFDEAVLFVRAEPENMVIHRVAPIVVAIPGTVSGRPPVRPSHYWSVRPCQQNGMAPSALLSEPSPCASASVPAGSRAYLGR
jgi:hypothetical protein